MKKNLSYTLLVGMLIALIQFCANELFAQEQELRIIKKGAFLKLHPNDESQNIMDLPLGAVLQYEEMKEGWFKIRMSSAESGKSVIGYVHSSYVELLKQMPSKSEIKQPEVFSKQQDYYYNWKREMGKAQSMYKSGIPLLVVGTALLTPCLYFVIRGPGPGRYYYTWAKILMGVGIFGGTASIIFGISNMSRGTALIRQLEIEGEKRGYIKIGLIPNYSAIGFQICFAL